MPIVLSTNLSCDDGHSVYSISSHSHITVSDVNVSLQDIGLSNDPRVNDLKLGRDYALRQKGDHVVELIVKRSSLAEYLDDMGGDLWISTLVRNPLPRIRKIQSLEQI